MSWEKNAGFFCHRRPPILSSGLVVPLNGHCEKPRAGDFDGWRAFEIEHSLASIGRHLPREKKNELRVCYEHSHDFFVALRFACLLSGCPIRSARPVGPCR